MCCLTGGGCSWQSPCPPSASCSIIGKSIWNRQEINCSILLLPSLVLTILLTAKVSFALLFHRMPGPYFWDKNQELPPLWKAMSLYFGLKLMYEVLTLASSGCGTLEATDKITFLILSLPRGSLGTEEAGHGTHMPTTHVHVWSRHPQSITAAFSPDQASRTPHRP